MVTLSKGRSEDVSSSVGVHVRACVPVAVSPSAKVMPRLARTATPFLLRRGRRLPCTSFPLRRPADSPGCMLSALYARSRVPELTEAVHDPRRRGGAPRRPARTTSASTPAGDAARQPRLDRQQPAGGDAGSGRRKGGCRPAARPPRAFVGPSMRSRQLGHRTSPPEYIHGARLAGRASSLADHEHTAAALGRRLEQARARHDSRRRVSAADRRGRVRRQAFGERRCPLERRLVSGCTSLGLCRRGSRGTVESGGVRDAAEQVRARHGSGRSGARSSKARSNVYGTRRSSRPTRGLRREETR